MRASTIARKALKMAALPPGVLGGRRAGDVVILLYHRVGETRREIDIPPKAFETEIAALARSEEVRTLDDALNDATAGSVVVTFDDGFIDFYDRVVPLLVGYQVPALLYLATGLVLPTVNDALTWAQLREAVATGMVTVGAHTHNHADLSHATEDVAAEEMTRSKRLIEDELGVECRHFAFPWAVASTEAQAAAARLFDTAALHAWRTNRRGHIDPHRLGRTPVLRSDGPFMFSAKTRGMLDGEAFFYRALGRGPWSKL